MDFAFRHYNLQLYLYKVFILNFQKLCLTNCFVKTNLNIYYSIPQTELLFTTEFIWISSERLHDSHIKQTQTFYEYFICSLLRVCIYSIRINEGPLGDLCSVILFIFQFIWVIGKPYAFQIIHLIFMWFC